MRPGQRDSVGRNRLSPGFSCPTCGVKPEWAAKFVRRWQHGEPGQCPLQIVSRSQV